MQWMTPYLEEIVLVCMVSVIIMLVIFITMLVRYSKLRRSYVQMLKGSEVPNLEKVMGNVHESIAELRKQQHITDDQIEQIKINMKLQKANVGILRYNGFDQQGSELSFSIAIVDHYLNGLVITGLHSREETYVYAKPVEQGDSTYALSPEEKEAISQAVSKSSF